MKQGIKRLISATTAAAVLTAGAVWLPDPEETPLSTITAYAEGEELTYGNYKYRVLDNGMVEITGWAGNEESVNIDIPAQIDGKQVYSIGERAFSNKWITSLKLPDGLVEIKRDAFMNYNDIPIEIPETVQNMEWDFEFSMMGHPKYFALPKHLSVKSGSFPVYKYLPADNGEVIIDELNNAYYSETIVVPEKICGRTVCQVGRITANNPGNIRMIVCADNVSVPEQDGKIIVKYRPEAGENCTITSVTGNSPNAIVGLDGLINDRKVTAVSGINATFRGIAVPREAAGDLDVDYPVLSSTGHGKFINVVGVDLKGAESLEISDYFGIAKLSTVFLPQNSNNITVSCGANKMVYTETENEIELTEIIRGSDNRVFVPASIGGKAVTKISENCMNVIAGMYTYIPYSFDSDLISTFVKIAYIENPNGTVSATGYVRDYMGVSEEDDLEKVFGKPIDTYVTRSGLQLQNTENKDINIVKYEKNGSDEFVITQMNQGGDEKSTLTIPESIIGIPVSGISQNAIDSSVTSLIVPDSISGSVPANIDKVTYETDAQGNFTVTSASENANVNIPESVGGKAVDTVIVDETIRENVEVPETSNTVAYTKDNSGKVTVTDVQVGEGKETAVIPNEIGETEVDTVVVKEEVRDKVEVPRTSSTITYTEDETGNITIAEVEVGEDKETPVFPEKIGNNVVDTVIVKDGTNVGISETASKITYTEDEGGKVTVTDVQQGKDKDSVSVPSTIGGTDVETVIVKDGSNVTVPETASKITYTEDKDGNVTVTDVQVGEGKDTAVVPENIGDKTVDTVVVKEDLRDNVQIPPASSKITYTEDETGNVTITGVEVGKDKETPVFPEKIGDAVVDTVIIKDGMDVDTSSTTSKITYTEDGNGKITVTDVQVGDGKDTAIVPENIGDKTVDTVIVESGTDVTVPQTASKITYTEDETGNVTITEVEVGKDKETPVFPEKIGDTVVDTVIVKDGINVGISDTASKITYTEDESGKITITDVQKGTGQETVTIPENIGDKTIETVIVKEGSDVTVPETASKITYTEDEDGKVTITGVVPGKDSSGTKPVEIPSEIGGNTPSISEEAKGEMAEIPHTHSGGTATCTKIAECVVCGAEYGKLAEHSYGDWLSDVNGHYKECSVCGAKTESAAHSGGTATCVKKAECTACGAEYGETGEHSYGDWLSDVNGHYKECSVCGAKTESAAHSGGTATCVKKAECTACGAEYGETGGHSYGDWLSDVNGHYKECSVCGAKTESAAHSGGTATTTAKAKCSVCGAEYGKLADESGGGSYRPRPTRPAKPSIDINVTTGTDVPDTDILDDEDDIADKVLTDDDEEEIEDGGDVEIKIDIADGDKTVSQADLAAINAFLARNSGYKLGFILDISLSKAINSDVAIVHETNGEITFKITVPEKLRASDREFAVLRVHNGAVALLNDLDKSADTITFKTDKFSAYAVLYKDPEPTSKPDDTSSTTGGDTGSSTTSGDTGSSTTSGDTGSTTSGDAGSSTTSGDTGDGSTSGDTGDSSTSGDTGSSTTSGDSSDSNTGDWDTDDPTQNPHTGTRTMALGILAAAGALAAVLVRASKCKK